MVSHIMVLPFSHLAFPWPADALPPDIRPVVSHPPVSETPQDVQRPSYQPRHSERTIYPRLPVRSARSGRVPTRTDHPGVRAKPAFEDLGRASVLVTGPGVVPATDPSSSSGDVAVILGAQL
ncbi:hypothetical protein C8J57DRAFT_1500572 [Mycena rebaudengoi]|nr:hypothetical protein C8J57DRAFT_1500572 [Mycena rebaudengoi]